MAPRADAEREAPAEPPWPALLSARLAWERDYVLRTLAAARGNVTQAARLAQITRRSFYAVLERVGVGPEEWLCPRCSALWTGHVGTRCPECEPDPRGRHYSRRAGAPGPRP